MADHFEVTVVSIGYRLAPEDPWPAGAEDCYDAAEWLVKNGPEVFGGELMFTGGEVCVPPSPPPLPPSITPLHYPPPLPPSIAPPPLPPSIPSLHYLPALPPCLSSRTPTQPNPNQHPH